MGAKSRVKPAKMLMFRSAPRTSERVIVECFEGEDEGSLEGEGGIAGPKLGFDIGI